MNVQSLSHAVQVRLQCFSWDLVWPCIYFFYSMSWLVSIFTCHDSLCTWSDALRSRFRTVEWYNAFTIFHHPETYRSHRSCNAASTDTVSFPQMKKNIRKLDVSDGLMSCVPLVVLQGFHSSYFRFGYWAWMAGSETKNCAGNVWTTSRLCRLDSWQHGLTGKTPGRMFKLVCQMQLLSMRVEFESPCQPYQSFWKIVFEWIRSHIP